LHRPAADIIERHGQPWHTGSRTTTPNAGELTALELAYQMADGHAQGL